MALGDLFVSIRASASEWASDVKAISRDADALEKSIKPIKDIVGEMGKAFTVAGGAIVGAFGLAVKAAADFGDEMNDASKKTGVTTEQLSKLKLAADTSGSSFEGLQNGLIKLSRNMDLANAGGKEQLKFFEAAGISAKDLAAAHGDVTKILFQLADAFKNAGADSDLAAISIGLLGKSGADLIPFLLEGSEGFKRWGDEAARSGRVVSKEAAEAADQFNDRLEVLKGSIEGFSGTIGEALIPSLTKLVDKATDTVNSLREWANEHPALIKLIGELGVALTGAGGILVGLAGLLTILPKLKEAWGLVATATGGTVAAFALVAAAIIHFKNEVATILVAAFATIVIGVEKVIGAFATLAEKTGAGELSKSLRLATDSVKAFREDLDSLVKQGEINFLTAQKTEKALAAETAARKKSSDAVKEHNIVLQKNTEAQKQMVKDLEAIQKIQLDIAQTGSNDVVKASVRAQEELDRQLNTMTDNFTDTIITKYKLVKEATELFFKQERELQNEQDALLRSTNTARIKEILESRKEDQRNWDEQIKANIKSADDMSRAWSVALGNVTSDFAKSISSIIFENGKLSSLVDIAKKTAENMFSAFLVGLFAPLTKKLSDLGAEFGKWVEGLVTSSKSAAGGVASAIGGGTSAAGGTGSAAGGLLGSVVSGAVGGVLSGAISAIAGARQEGTLNAIEFNTRATYINIAIAIDQLLKPILSQVVSIANVVVANRGQIGYGPGGQPVNVGGSGMSITINAGTIVGDAAAFARDIVPYISQALRDDGMFFQQR